MILAAILSALPLLANGAIERDVGARLAVANPTNSLSRFIGYSQNARRDIFIPNTNFWAKGIDFSCASPWNSAGGALRAGTLISKRHVVFAAHFPLPPGTRMLFVDGDGNVCPCYLARTKAISGTDIMIGALDAEVTPNIKPAVLLPADFHQFLPERGTGMPVATFNRQEKLFLTESNAIPTNRLSKGYVRSSVIHRKDFGAFRERIVVGDSGNPVFLLIGDEPVLLCCLQFGGCGLGPALHLYANEIQRAMDELCPGYKLEFYSFNSR